MQSSMALHGCGKSHGLGLRSSLIWSPELPEISSEPAVRFGQPLPVHCRGTNTEPHRQSIAP